MTWTTELGTNGQNDALTWCQEWRTQSVTPDILYLLPGRTREGERETTPKGFCDIFWGWIPDTDTGQCNLQLFFGSDADPANYNADSRKWVAHRQHGTMTGIVFDLEETPFGGMRIQAHDPGRFLVRCAQQVYAQTVAAI